jgi:hypothetical protein
MTKGALVSLMELNNHSEHKKLEQSGWCKCGANYLQQFADEMLHEIVDIQ